MFTLPWNLLWLISPLRHSNSLTDRSNYTSVTSRQPIRQVIYYRKVAEAKPPQELFSLLRRRDNRLDSVRELRGNDSAHPTNHRGRNCQSRGYELVYMAVRLSVVPSLLPQSQRAGVWHKYQSCGEEQSCLQSICSGAALQDPYSLSLQLYQHRRNKTCAWAHILPHPNFWFPAY